MVGLLWHSKRNWFHKSQHMDRMKEHHPWLLEVKGNSKDISGIQLYRNLTNHIYAYCKPALQDTRYLSGLFRVNADQYQYGWWKANSAAFMRLIVWCSKCRYKSVLSDWIKCDGTSVYICHKQSYCACFTFPASVMPSNKGPRETSGCPK